MIATDRASIEKLIDDLCSTPDGIDDRDGLVDPRSPKFEVRVVLNA